MKNKEFPTLGFEEKIKSIKDELKNYCDDTIKLYRKSRSLLDSYNKEVVEEISKTSKQLDIKGYEIERKCISFLATEQPVASDLMYIESAIRVISHVKRIAYLCNNIAEASKEIKNINSIDYELLDNLHYMADYVQVMITAGFSAFINQDINIARELPEDDDKVDDLFDLILKQVTESIAEKIDFAVAIINVLFIARYLERIGDRIVNIGDRVVFINTQKRPDIENLKKEDNN